MPKQYYKLEINYSEIDIQNMINELKKNLHQYSNDSEYVKYYNFLVDQQKQAKDK